MDTQQKERMNNLLRGRVAIVTGAGGGLGRAHALALAKHGARVVVNDLGGNEPGSPAELVGSEILSAGGEAFSNSADVTDFNQIEAMIADTIARWGHVDILVNNAGLLRDKAFAKMTLEDFRLVIEVHLMGSVNCTKAVWSHMRAQNFGRIVMTTSSSGLYGSFGQSNYSAAKMALVGLMQTLALEGAKNNICVNCLAPTAATAMTEKLLPVEVLALMSPAAVTPGLIALVGEEAPTRTILLAGAGSYEQAYITMTQGIFVGDAEDATEQILSRLSEIGDRAGEIVPGTGPEQFHLEISKAGISADNLFSTTSSKEN
jgi:NAD(P)-dependent dehydrogenase (short-subunit alcohol dehydrogenase family)